MKKLSIALLCGMLVTGSAIAASPNTTKDNMSNSQSMSQQRPVPAEEAAPSADWHAKQWDKSKWDAMTPAERTEYKSKHQHYWNKMTPEERDAMRAKHKGAKNYMDDKWDQPTSVNNPQNVGGENKGTPK